MPAPPRDPCPCPPFPPLRPDGRRGPRNQKELICVSDPQPAKICRKALAAEQARLARFFQTINKHRKALDLAIEENFGCLLEGGGWRIAFDSVELHLTPTARWSSPAITPLFSTPMSRSSRPAPDHGWSACSSTPPPSRRAGLRGTPGSEPQRHQPRSSSPAERTLRLGGAT